MRVAKMLQALRASDLTQNRAAVKLAFDTVRDNNARGSNWTLRNVQDHLGSQALKVAAANYAVKAPFAAEKPATGARLAPWVQGPRLAK